MQCWNLVTAISQWQVVVIVVIVVTIVIVVCNIR